MRHVGFGGDMASTVPHPYVPSHQDLRFTATRLKEPHIVAVPAMIDMVEGEPMIRRVALDTAPEDMLHYELNPGRRRKLFGRSGEPILTVTPMRGLNPLPEHAVVFEAVENLWLPAQKAPARIRRAAPPRSFGAPLISPVTGAAFILGQNRTVQGLQAYAWEASGIGPVARDLESSHRDFYLKSTGPGLGPVGMDPWVLIDAASWAADWIPTWDFPDMTPTPAQAEMRRFMLRTRPGAGEYLRDGSY
jgi:hypothetical protein